MKVRNAFFGLALFLFAAFQTDECDQLAADFGFDLDAKPLSTSTEPKDLAAADSQTAVNDDRQANDAYVRSTISGDVGDAEEGVRHRPKDSFRRFDLAALALARGETERWRDALARGKGLLAEQQGLSGQALDEEAVFAYGISLSLYIGTFPEGSEERARLVKEYCSLLQSNENLQTRARATGSDENC